MQHTQAKRLKIGSRRERETSIGEVQSEEWAEGGGEPEAGEWDSMMSEQKEPLREESTEDRRPPRLPPFVPAMLKKLLSWATALFMLLSPGAGSLLLAQRSCCWLLPPPNIGSCLMGPPPFPAPPDFLSGLAGAHLVQ